MIKCPQLWAVTVNAEIFIGNYFLWAGTPTKIKPAKVCTHIELATVITVGYAHPLKFIPPKILPTKYFEHKNLYVYGTRIHCRMKTNNTFLLKCFGLITKLVPPKISDDMVLL